MKFVCILETNKGCKLLGIVANEDEATGILIKHIDEFFREILSDDALSELEKPFAVKCVPAWGEDYDKGFAYHAEYMTADYKAYTCTGYALYS